MAGKHRGWCGLALVVAWMTSSDARAEQVVVYDQTWVHSSDLADSHYRLPPDAGTPADWTSPVDYSQGSAWVYLEVHSKPTEQQTKFQVCFEATPTYACTFQSPTYTEVGTYEWETPFADFWSPPEEYVDWTQGVHDIACILKDTENGKPSADNVGEEIASLYMPTEVRLVVTLVEAGSVYVPPTPTGEGTGSESGGSESEGGSSGGGDSSSTSGEPPATTSGADDSSSGGSTSGVMPESTSSGAGDSSGGDVEAEEESDAGCSCRVSAGEGRGLLAVVVLVAIARRRRERVT